MLEGSRNSLGFKHLFGRAPARAPAPALAGAPPNTSSQNGSSGGALWEPEPFCIARGGAKKRSSARLRLTVSNAKTFAPFFACSALGYAGGGGSAVAASGRCVGAALWRQRGRGQARRGRAATQAPGAGDGSVEQWRRKHRMQAAACASGLGRKDARREMMQVVWALGQNGVSLNFS